ncbi:hypothetical protein ACYOEI_42510, partial [Singulisphaera rosea]
MIEPNIEESPSVEETPSIDPTEIPRAWFSRRKLLLGAGAMVAAPPLATAWGYDPDWLTVTRH